MFTLYFDFIRMIKLLLKDQDGQDHVFVFKTVDAAAPSDLEEGAQVIDADPEEEISILDMLEQKGFELPYSCRAGACTSCCCGVSDGMDILDQNKAGEVIIDLEEDEFLTCIGGFQSKQLQDEEIHTVTMEVKNL